MEEPKNETGVSAAEEFKNLLQHIMTEEEFKAQLANARRKLKEEVQKKPLVALGVALATGFLLGSILKR